MAKVGGGAAGCVLAARLTEDLDVTVALLETGSEETKEPLTDVPLLAPSLGDSGVMLHYNGEPQQHACKSLNEQVLFNHYFNHFYKGNSFTSLFA